MSIDIRVPSFAPANSATATNTFRNEIAFFEQNTDGLIVDVMRNPGGSVSYLNQILALLMPVRIGVESARPAFEAMLAELLDVDAADLGRDDDGDYPVPLSDDHLLYLSLLEGDPDAGTPDTVHAFAILANGVDPSPELLTELNDLNRHVRFARLYWADGAVFVGDELLLSTLDAAELGHACRTVAALAARVAPMLEAVHGAG